MNKWVVTNRMSLMFSNEEVKEEAGVYDHIDEYIDLHMLCADVVFIDDEAYDYIKAKEKLSTLPLFHIYTIIQTSGHVQIKFES